MSTTRSVDVQNQLDKGLRTTIFVISSYCVATMVLVPLLTLTVSGYLAATGQYLLATVITIAGGEFAYWRSQRPKTDPVNHE